MNNEADVQLLQVLEKTTSPDQSELTAALSFLQQAAQTNLPELLKTLSNILCNTTYSEIGRRQAGLQLKNYITSTDENVRRSNQDRWVALSPDVRNHVKLNVFRTMGSEPYRPSAAAQCVHYIALIELPLNMWPSLITSLVEFVTKEQSSQLLRECSVQAIGYICQDIDIKCLRDRSNELLTAIVHGIRAEASDSSSLHTRRSAVKALFDALEFTENNFYNDNERNFIMQVVCESTQSTDVQIKVTALQCINKIMNKYYDLMESYMGPALFAIILDSMNSTEDDVTLQGIEFWSTVCDEELDLALELVESSAEGRQPVRVSRFYAKGALQYIMPVILQTLSKQEEFDDEDEWRPSKAAGVCLMLLAACCQDDLLPFVFPFVNDNIKDADWRKRDAAVMALGSVLEGPDSQHLSGLLGAGVPILIEMLSSDSSVVVKDSSAWALGKICELHVSCILSDQQILKTLLEVLVVNLVSAEPRVSGNVCWALASIAENAYNSAKEVEQNGTVDVGGGRDDSPKTYAISSYFDVIVQKLLETTDRPDAGTSNLRTSAYEALMKMVEFSAKDCYESVQKTVMVILTRLQQVLHMESRIQSDSDRLQFNDIQSQLCATLQSVLKKIEKEHAPQISDPIMTALLQIFECSMKRKASVIQEDALMAVGALIEVLGEGFAKYVEAFMPFLQSGLSNLTETQVIESSVGIVGDLYRSMGGCGGEMLRHTDTIITILLQDLSDSSTLNRCVKPHIVSVFGDIALSVGPSNFNKYLEVVLQTLMQAAVTTPDFKRNESNGEVAPLTIEDLDEIEYINELRSGILEAYAGILQGMKPSSSISENGGSKENNNGGGGGGAMVNGGNVILTPEQLGPELTIILKHVPFVLNFIVGVVSFEDRTDDCISSSAGLIGDLCSVFGRPVLPLLDIDPISTFLQAARKSKNSERIRRNAVWAIKEIKSLKASS